MNRWQAAGAMIFGGLLCAQTPTASAHHSYSSWAPTYMTFTGTVKEFQYTSPHIWIQVLVPSPDGTQVEWGFETGSPASMKASGWTPKMLQAGDKITARVHPKRDGTKEGSIVELDMPDGKVIKVMDLVLIKPPGAGGPAPGSPVPPTQP